MNFAERNTAQNEKKNTFVNKIVWGLHKRM